MNPDTYTAAMRASLAECVAALQRMDARLLKLTASPKDCEPGEITRARKLLDTDPAQLAPAHEIRPAAANPVFEFDGSRGSLAEYLQANVDDSGLCEWLPTAAIGDTYAGCTRVA